MSENRRYRQHEQYDRQHKFERSDTAVGNLVGSYLFPSELDGMSTGALHKIDSEADIGLEMCVAWLNGAMLLVIYNLLLASISRALRLGLEIFRLSWLLNYKFCLRCFREIQRAVPANTVTY